MSIPLFAIGDLVELAPALGAAAGTYQVVEQDGTKWLVRGPQDASHPAELLVLPSDLEVAF